MMRKSLSLTILLCLIPTLAQAGSFVDGVYTSNLGYSFMPPENWQRCDAANVSGLGDSLPENLKTMNFMHTDVVFFPSFGATIDTLEADRARAKELEANKDLVDPNAPPPVPKSAQAPSFSANIAVMVLKHTPSNKNVETAKSLADRVSADIRDIVSYATNFKITKSTFDRKVGRDRFDYSMSYNYRSREINIEQSIYLVSDRAIVITCTSDANDHIDGDANWCSKAIDSFQF